MIRTAPFIVLAGSRRLVASSSKATRSIATFTRSYPALQPSASTISRKQPPFFQHSFHPSIAVSSRAGSEHAEQRRWTSLLAISALAGIVTVYSLSRTPLNLEAAPSTGSDLTSINADPSKQVVIDPDTGLSFPQYLPAPTSFASTAAPRLRLVGLGVRTVSFLSVRVYVAALYMDEAALARLPLSADQTVEQHIKALLDAGTPCVIRIVPVRNTDFNHLRDGFIRALQNRLKKALKSATPVNEALFQESIQEVKDSFPRGSVPKGSALDLVIQQEGRSKGRMGLQFEYEGEVFGQIQGREAGKQGDGGFTVARELVLAYFADKGEISGAFKRSVEQGLMGQ